MDSVAVGFWGAFFGAAGLSLIAAVLAFRQSARRVATTGSLSALLSCLYVLIFLGWLPGDSPEAHLRVQAHAAVLVSAVLAPLLFWLLGVLRGSRARAIVAATAAVTAVVLAIGWSLPPLEALALSVAMQGMLVALSLAAALRSARRGAAAGWLAFAGVCFMSLAIAGLTWHALDPASTPWPVHAASALAAIAYTACIGGAMWARYAYLIDVRQAMVHGPSYDPVTRLASHSETHVMVGEAFARAERDGRPLGVLAVSVANFDALEHLHGRAAYNHGLFICASRLRRLLPPGVQLGRLDADAFLLLVPRPSAADPLMELAHQVVQRLSRPVGLGTSKDMAELEYSRTTWVAEVGVGVLVAPPQMRPQTAVAAAKAMSRTAWSYASRVACYDEEERQIAELAPEPAR
ncbi:GGDEF domain-containing protein [Ramlibacter henchirensis]|uniref:GGDEF domain-containing protein n=1 Tax=Ramlibacter henchirensis TaxID=204072 RepID=A0A4Z0BM38_9BURK|nr:GGDEF domain-containing protein [Ramlibacter henchirensis]TFY99164.1 GGDEF domain-containing protein [Ramlibacter henchirensis]